MKKNSGITLTTAIITVLLLTIIAGLSINYGIDSYQNSKIIKFETYMKMLQKKTDLILEEELNYNTMGSPLTDEQRTTLQTIIQNNTNIVTRDETEEKLRYFSSNDLNEIFNIPDVEDDIIINFANRDVISLNGVEKDNIRYYTEYTLYN